VVVVTLSDLPEEEQHRVKEEMKKELEELEAIRMHERLRVTRRHGVGWCRRRTPPTPHCLR
jgi:hypothetical protein